MEWTTLIPTATAVVALFSSILGMALVVAQIRKTWREAPPSRPTPLARRSRWRLALVVLSTAVVVTVCLRFWAWPPPADSLPPPGVPVSEVAPAPHEVSPPMLSEVVLKTGSFTVKVPKVFDKAAQDQAYLVTGSPKSSGWLVALSRKVGSEHWYAQSVIPIKSEMTIQWNKWTEVVDADVCLLEVSGKELPAGLRQTPNFGSISESMLAGLSEELATRSDPCQVRVVHK
jgi:hypothetical protein